MSVAQRIQDLLQSDLISAETRKDLGDYERQAAQGQLAPEDADYIDALHRRLFAPAKNSPGRVARPTLAASSRLDPLEQAVALFDALYHPDHGTSTIGDKDVRDAIWQEYRRELDRLRD